GGILVAHVGIITLLCGELITGLYAVEANLTVHENESISFVEEREHAELAVVFPSRAEENGRHVVFPERILKKGGRLSHADLPFDLEVVKYMSNSEIVDEGNQRNPATAGYGKETGKIGVERKENAGADSSAGRDIASAYVTLYEKGTDKVIDTYLLSI